MYKQECVAMLLAGGEGRRLGVLTSNVAKPAVHFGGKYRIIDFTLSNCANSGINTVGVLTQYKPLVLNSHIGNGSTWNLDKKEGGIAILSPEENEKCHLNGYSGTANAVAQNIAFINQYEPEFVLIIAGDHIYNMDYQKMLEHHKKNKADVTISVTPVKWEEASQFGIMSIDFNYRIIKFAEKPAVPESNLASMGIYIFNWQTLKSYLLIDDTNSNSCHDFGKDILPAMLNQGANMVAYPYEGYWKDVGTISSLWEAHMDMLDDNPTLKVNQVEWPVFSNPMSPVAHNPHYVAPTATIRNSIVSEGCKIYGAIERSVIFYGTEIYSGSLIKDSVIMPNVRIGKNVVIHKAIIGEGSVINDGAIIGTVDTDEITVIGENEIVSPKQDKLSTMFTYIGIKIKLKQIG